MDLSERLRGYEFFDIRLFELAGTPVTLATLVIFAVVVLVTFWSSWLLQRAVAKALKIRGVREQGSMAVAKRLVHYLVLAVGLGIALETIGINLSMLFAAGAIFAVGLGFAMQNIAQNFVSGVILLIERSIKPGDVLRVDGRLVKVSRMGIRATIARTLDEEDLIIPNAQIVQAAVTNYTLRDSLYRLRTLVGVVYASDMELVRRTLEKTAGSLPWRSSHKEPIIQMTQFGSSSVDFDVSVWIEDPWRAQMHKSDLNEAIWWALKDAGVIIAFPQLDVHFDPPVHQALEQFSGTR